MFNRIGHITGQHDRMSADVSNSQQIFPSQHIRIEPVVQIYVRIASTSFDPLWLAKHVTESVQVWLNFWVLGQDVSSTVCIEMETMPKHILEHPRHTLHIPHRCVTRKLGAADYLPKPFERDDILRAVRDTLREVTMKPKP